MWRLAVTVLWARISSVLTWALVVALLAGTWAADGAVPGEIDRYVKAEMELNGIPGLSLAVVEDGTVWYSQAYGVRSTETQEAMRVETPVELASVSKSFTALAILRLERAGRVDRDFGVARVLPELKGADWQPVTLRDLLRHRSGLRRRHDFFVPCCERPGTRDLPGAARHLAGADLASSPGETFAYANSNYVLLAAVVQRVSGVRFAPYMRETIFRPLGMRHTTTEVAEALSWGRADPHEWQWGRVRVSPSRFLGWFGSSRIKASAADMGRYMEALLDPESALLDVPDSESAWWEQLEPDYDLGWSVQTEAVWLDGEFVLEHTGEIWGGNTATVLAPHRRAGVAVLTNLGTNRAKRIARGILGSRVGSQLPPPRKMSRTEIPDTWALAFLASAAAFFAAVLSYGLRAWWQVQRGIRTWCPTHWGVTRALALATLAVALIHRASWGSVSHLAAFPSTVRLALPTLVASVTALLLLAATVGLAPKRGR